MRDDVLPACNPVCFLRHYMLVPIEKGAIQVNFFDFSAGGLFICHFPGKGF